MNNLFPYLAQSSACLLGFYLFYYFLLKKETGFQFNRVYLLATPLLSFLIPLLKIPLQIFNAPLQPIYEGTAGFTVIANPSVIAVQPAEAPFDWMPVIWGIYGLGLTYFSFRFAQQLIVIQKFIRQNPPEITQPGKIKVIHTAGHLPTFSFLNYLFWDNTQNLTETERQKIWQHESVHIYQKHTWDILYLETLGILFWFNPLVYLYKKALASTHEFIADAVVIRETNEQDYTTLLVKQVINQSDLSLGHYFSKSLTLKRMKMLQKNNLRPNRLKQFLALPLLGLLLLLFSFNNASVADIIDNPAGLVSSDNSNSESKAEKNGVIAPQFPGGESELRKYLRRNIKYPPKAWREQQVGNVIIQVSINKSGVAENYKVLVSDNKSLEEEALQLLSGMPNWEPARQNNQPVNADYVFPFHFQLSGQESNEFIYKPIPILKNVKAFTAEPVVITGYATLNKNKLGPGTVVSKIAQDNPQNKLPQFPGGKQEFQQFLANHTQYPATALKSKISGQAILQATIDADGKISNIKTLHADHTAFEQEAISVLREMPRWEHGLKDGKPAAFTLVFPFVFGLESKQSIPALRLPANRSQLYVQDAINIIGYSQVISGKTFVKKSVTPSGNTIKTTKPEPVKTKPAPAAKENTPPKTQTPAPVDEPIFSFVEQQPIFQGGEQEMNKFIKANLKYPAEAKEKNVSGLVVIQFIVDKTGQVLDPKVVKSLGTGTDEEAIRMVNKMPPFTPAKQNGKPVIFRYTLPIRFDIPSKATTGATPDAPEPRIVFTFVEMQPQFPGGDAALKSFVAKNLQYPQAALDRRAEGIVVVQFVVNTDGKIIQPKVVKSLGYGLDEEALRVVKLLPTFKPARQNNHIVAFQYTLPIRFALATEAEAAKNQNK